MEWVTKTIDQESSFRPASPAGKSLRVDGNK